MSTRLARCRYTILPFLLSLWLFAIAAVADDGETTADAVKIVATVNHNLSHSSSSHCRDNHDKCNEWAETGECKNNPIFMQESCAISCSKINDGDENNDEDPTTPSPCEPKTTVTTSTATVHDDGEDAAIGAFRYGEEHRTSLLPNIVEHVLDVARKLGAQLESNDGYQVPRDVTHCGKRRCSAGKLWTRALEMRKADMNDAAGADLIRALLRTGIESDFVIKCERELASAFLNIQRQREREGREAIEEAKLEERRREEEDAVEEARQRKEEYEADFTRFGVRMEEHCARCAAERGDVTVEEGSDQNAEGEDEQNAAADRARIDDLTSSVFRQFVIEGPKGSHWDETVRLIKKIPSVDKTVDVLLIEARCHEVLGNPKEALSAAGRLMKKAASYEPWENGTPRMMAATLGANAAMHLGLSPNAVSFYQTVLKYDPEQSTARLQYRGLKKVVKLMDKAEEQIKKGYNTAASVFVDDCLSAMRGLDVDSPLFRSKIQLKQCTILSGMGKHEEALGSCDSAVEVRIGNDSVSPASRKEAHLARAEALLLDMDYDEAVQDFRAALELVPDNDADFAEEMRDLNHKLQSTIQKQQAWNGGQMNNRYNEHTGFPNGMPPQRDHAKILQLPIDLNERGHDIQCAWLKKQFKVLVRKFHPDKYKGNKKRAARKFQEVKDSKESLSKAWGC